MFSKATKAVRDFVAARMKIKSPSTGEIVGTEEQNTGYLMRRVWEIDPVERETEMDIAYSNWMRREISAPLPVEMPPRRPYVPGDDGAVWLDGRVANIPSGTTTKPQEFELTNDLYHLIIDCTEIILDYCRANNIRPAYRVGMERNEKFVSIDVAGRGYRLSDKSGLPGLEDFLRRVYE